AKSLVVTTLVVSDTTKVVTTRDTELRFWDCSVPQSHKRRRGSQRGARPNHNSWVTYVDRRAGTGFGYQVCTAIHICSWLCSWVRSDSSVLAFATRRLSGMDETPSPRSRCAPSNFRRNMQTLWQDLRYGPRMLLWKSANDATGYPYING